MIPFSQTSPNFRWLLLYGAPSCYFIFNWWEQ